MPKQDSLARKRMGEMKMNTQVSRRRLLAAVGTTTVASLAGCSTVLTNGETVSFDAPHGTTIDGSLYGDGDCGIVLVPQINLDRGSWSEQANTLTEEGYLVLAIDEDPDDRVNSILGAVDYLTDEHSITQSVLIGASSGGEAVVKANATAPNRPIAGTVAISPGGGADQAADLQGRLLFAVSRGDDSRFVETTRQLHQNAPDPKELAEYDGSAHGQDIFDTDHGDDLMERITNLLSSACDG